MNYTSFIINSIPILVYNSVSLVTWPVVKTMSYCPPHQLISEHSLSVRYFFIRYSKYPTWPSSLSVAFMAGKSNSKKDQREWITRAISQKWDGALQKWTDFMMPSGKCFVFPIQCTEHNLKLTNWLWNTLSVSSHMDVACRNKRHLSLNRTSGVTP